MNILKVLGGTTWESSPTLLKIYRALIRSVLHYASVFYNSARKPVFRKPDPIAHQCIRLCIGAFRSSPVESLYNLANEPPLSMRREKLLRSYGIKVASLPEHLGLDNVKSPKHLQLFHNKSHIIPPLGIRLQTMNEKAVINSKTFYFVLEWAPWNNSKSHFDFRLLKFIKASTPPIIYQQAFNKMPDEYKYFFFTNMH